MLSLDAGLKKWGLEISPRYPKPYTWLYSESESDYEIRFKYMVRSHSLVIDYLETHDVPYRISGFRYYDILGLALEARGMDWNEYWAEYDNNYTGLRQ